MRLNDNDYGGFVIGNPYEGDGVYNPFTNNSGVGGGGGTSSPITFPDVPGPRGGGIIASPDVVVDPGGGGVVFVPPVKDDAPVFVPPTYSDIDLGSLNIHLIAEETAQFLNGDTTIGYGLTTKESYQPALKFGSSKTYKANVEGKISKNYYELAIVKSNPPKDSLLGGPKDLAFDDNLVRPIRDVIRGVDLFDSISTRKFDSPITNLKFNFGGNGFENTIKTPTRLDSLYKEHIQITEYVYDSISQTYNWFASRTAEKNGTIALNFSFIKKEKPIDDYDLPPDEPPYPPTFNPIDPVVVPYNIIFVSNKTSQLGDFIKLNYQFVSNRGDILEGGDDVLLSDGNIDEQFVDELYLSRGTVNFNITESYETARLILNQQNLPEGFGYTAFFYAPKAVYDRTWNELNRADVTPDDFANRGWTYVNKSFKVSGAEFLSNIAVAIVFDEQRGSEITKRKPVVQLTDSLKEFEVKESDSDKVITIPFTTTNTEFVDFYISESPIRIPAVNGFVELSFVKDFAGEYGSKIVYFVPYNEFGRGDTVSTIIKFTSVNDFPSVIDITLPESVDVPSFSDLNIEFEVSYNTFAATSVDVFIVDGGNDIPLASAQPPRGAFTVNLRTILTQFLNGKQTDLTFKFVPYNRGGVRELIGNPYELTTKVIYPSLFLTEADIKNSIFQSISENLKFNDLGPDSKYLTHLLNFGNNEQILISSWEEDDWTLSEKVEDEIGNLIVKNKVDTLLLKLYSPLPATISTNSTLWVTKLMSNPLIETVILTEQDDIKCPPIKGPNFSIEVDFVKGNSTSYESLDNLILSASVSSSANLISTYLSSSLVNTDELNIEYYAGPNYLTGSIVWDNFVHFSSAKERVENFVYKVQLIEAYDNLIANASATEFIEIQRQNLKKNQLINNFDGFEKFLYIPSSTLTNSGSNSITWPYQNGSRLLSSNTIVQQWYANLIELAEDYDIENPNWVQNNIPQYILNNTENDNYLLFFSMIGHHFDNIYYFTKSIEKSRGFGYKSKNGVADKLLFDVLKSFNWDAKNLAADEDLWKYVYGQDSLGNTIQSNPAKQRTNEVWRRILNNIPYLLKHKGTKKAIYAIMACYGIPSSNLSILEFGGPEPAKRFDNAQEDVGTTKLLMDNTTYALTMNTGSKIEMEWKTTDKGEKPKTIELFLKPAYSGDWNVLSGSAGWKVQVSGSAGSEYGRVKYVDNGSTLISSDLLPIFNGRFFGISLSSGSYGITLDTKQVEKDRTIFEHSYSSSVANTFGPQSNVVLLGNNYSGSIDEFRLWSTTLSSSVFFRHVLFPEMINGNHISSSTDDLYFRLDFEYPKNLNETYGTASLINVDTNIYFSSSVSRNDLEVGIIPIISGSTILSENTKALLSASCDGFVNISTYPYNFEPIERTVALEVPNIGATRYSTNKVRFETQTDLNGNDVSDGVNLSIKNRATKKAFDQSPIDSNRIGLLFSPTKELNVDIAKSFGGINLDNYIGDPSDEYKSNYKSLDKLRKYYFNRFDGRDIYQYINLIKSYEKSLFEDIKKMLPARVKATTGLLIEPHILERSTIEQSKPTGDEYQKESIIDAKSHINTLAETNQYETVINSELSKNLIGENNQYEANIVSSSIDKVAAESYQYETPIYVNDELTPSAESYQKEVSIDAKLSNGTVLTELDVYDINAVVGQSDYESVGFGIYAENGHAIRTYFDKEGRKIKERIKVDLIKEEKRRDVVKFNVVTPAGQGDPRGGTFLTSSIYYETKLNIQPYSGSKVINPGTGSIVEVTPLSGYLPTHYRNTSDLTTGMRNSYYLGSKNTAATTLDGAPPVETFATNPNTLRVNKAGRDASEPILEVE